MAYSSPNLGGTNIPEAVLLDLDMVLKPTSVLPVAVKGPPPPKTIPVARNGPQTLDKPKVMSAKEIRTTDDYTRFIRQLEAKYPGVPGFDINRAVRQYFYSDDGRRNTMDVFDKWLGKNGGKNSPALKGIEKDLDGMPAIIKNPQGKPVNLSHMVVGVDAYYNRRMGIHGVTKIPADIARGFMLTHGGDFGQVFAGTILAAARKLGLTDDAPSSFDEAMNFASADQLRGNEDGIEIGMSMEKSDKYSAILDQHYHPPPPDYDNYYWGM